MRNVLTSQIGEEALKKTLIFQQNMYNYASKDNSIQLF